MNNSHLKSFRDYLRVLEDRGDAYHITDPTSPKLEIGAIYRYSCQNDLPMAIFDSVVGYPKYSITTGVVAFSSIPDERYSRLAIAFGLDPATPPVEIGAKIAAGYRAPQIDPVVIDNPEFKKEVHTGDDVDLFSVPAPLMHSGDGGDYLNTIGTMSVHTPDGRWTNWHVCRVMRVDKTHLTVWTRVHQHFCMIYQEWLALDKPMPFAFALAPEPAATVISGLRVPKGVDEVKVLGGFFGEPIEVAAGVTVPNHVPATAEVVIEGYFSKGEQHGEGPFAEYHGYLLPAAETEYLGTVTAISHKENPIIGAVAPGKPVDDDHMVIGVGGSGDMTDILKDAGLPIQGAWWVPESALHLIVVTTLPTWEDEYDGDADKYVDTLINTMMARAWQSSVAAHILVVDNDIDPTNLKDILWAWTSRVHPITGTKTYTGRHTTDMPPVFTEEERTKNDGHGPLAVHVGLLATKDSEPIPSTFEALYPKELQDRVLDRIRNVKAASKKK